MSLENKMFFWANFSVKSSRRQTLLMGIPVLFLSVVFVAVNLLTDLAYAKADPRVAYE